MPSLACMRRIPYQEADYKNISRLRYHREIGINPSRQFCASYNRVIQEKADRLNIETRVEGEGGQITRIEFDPSTVLMAAGTFQLLSKVIFAFIFQQWTSEKLLQFSLRQTGAFVNFEHQRLGG